MSRSNHNLARGLAALAALAAGLMLTAAAANAASSPTGQLDGWAYNVLHSTPAQAGTGQLDGWAYNILHSSPALAGADQLDGWAYTILHSTAAEARAVPFITEHSFGQNGNGRPPTGAVAASHPQGGFGWTEAGVGAAAALALALLVAAMWLVMRERHPLAHLHL